LSNQKRTGIGQFFYLLKLPREIRLETVMLGIFDSGSGGLTVVEAVRKRAPKADIIYFGDVANAPYGSRDDVELKQLTLNCIRVLNNAGAANIVSACNSVSAKVIQPMISSLGGETHPTIVEMVGPAASAAAQMGDYAWAGIATPATVESGMYQEMFERLGLQIEMISCPNLAGSIEFEDVQKIQEKISQLAERVSEKKVDKLLLGCTHYPLIESDINQALQAHGSQAEIFDPADAVACEAIARFGADGTGRLRVLTSKEDKGFLRRVKEKFGNVNVELLGADK
jgi:glutamate racemase